MSIGLNKGLTKGRLIAGQSIPDSLVAGAVSEFDMREETTITLGNFSEWGSIIDDRVLTVPVGSGQPTATEEQNNTVIASFNGTDELMQLDDASYDRGAQSAITFQAVVRAPNSGSEEYIWGCQSAADVAAIKFINDSMVIINGTDSLTCNIRPVNEWFILTCVFRDGGNDEIWAGINRHKNENAVGIGAGTGIMLGTKTTSAGFGEFDVAHIVEYFKALSFHEVQDNVNYLSAQWGI